MAFKEKEVVYGQKFINKLWNASRFVSMHLKDYAPSATPKAKPQLELVDHWILTKLNAVIRESTESFESYEYSKAKMAVEQFFWGDFCDNYLEMVKDRLYSKEDARKASRDAALYTIYTVLLDSLKMLGPFTPHVTEKYQRLFRDTGHQHARRGVAEDRSLMGRCGGAEAGDVAVQIIPAAPA
jgi:valyl-tRNA synthetase